MRDYGEAKFIVNQQQVKLLIFSSERSSGLAYTFSANRQETELDVFHAIISGKVEL